MYCVCIMYNIFYIMELCCVSRRIIISYYISWFSILLDIILYHNHSINIYYIILFTVFCQYPAGQVTTYSGYLSILWTPEHINLALHKRSVYSNYLAGQLACPGNFALGPLSLQWACGLRIFFRIPLHYTSLPWNINTLS